MAFSLCSLETCDKRKQRAEQTGGVLVAEITVRSKCLGSQGAPPLGKQGSWQHRSKQRDPKPSARPLSPRAAGL